MFYSCRALLVTGCTCIYAYNLAWGPEKWQKWGRAKQVLSRFCREEDNFYGNLRKRAPLSFILFREIFFYYVRHFYSQSISDRFSAHVRPVIQVAYYHAFSEQNVYYNKTIYTRNIDIVLCLAPLFLLWDHRILLDVLPI